MNRKQRKRKLERAKAHQAQSKGLIEKGPINLKQYNRTIGEINARYGLSDPKPFPEKADKSSMTTMPIGWSNPEANFGKGKLVAKRLSWYFAAYLKFQTFWRFIRGNNSSNR